MMEYSNTILLVTSSIQKLTKNRNGDIYKFERGKKVYIGSASLLNKIKFNLIGSSVPHELIETEIIANIIPEAQFDDLDVYIPYLRNGKLLIPTPLSEKHSLSWGYRYYDCTISGSTVWPQILELENVILRIITILCDNEEPDKTFQIYSHWTYINKTIVPANFLCKDK